MAQRLKVGDKAPEAALLNAQGGSVSLSAFWQDGPTLLSFVRHFG